MAQQFRKEALAKASSSEDLNEYIRVARPSVWLMLGAIIVFLVSFLIWGIFGRMDTSFHAAGYADNGVLSCYLREAEYNQLTSDTRIQAGSYDLGTFNGQGLLESETAIRNRYVNNINFLTALALNDGEWRYQVDIPATAISDGATEVTFITESTNFLAFVFN